MRLVKSSAALIDAQRVNTVVDLETVVVIFFLAFVAWGIYFFLLKDVSIERHRSLKAHFRNLMGHIVAGIGFLTVYELLVLFHGQSSWPDYVSPYAGFMTIVWGSIVFIKIARIIALEYLFWGSMRAGVPLLLVNIFTLILSLIMSGWILATIFDVNVSHLLATSAVLSIVLGLALQDTLGNLFAGIALQLDKPFEIGDWIEARNGADRIAGQVREISWRATILIALTDELVTIPNRNMAQWQIANFGARQRPFLRSQIFRIPLDANLDKAKTVLLAAAEATGGILKDRGRLFLLRKPLSHGSRSK